MKNTKTLVARQRQTAKSLELDARALIETLDAQIAAAQATAQQLSSARDDVIRKVCGGSMRSRSARSPRATRGEPTVQAQIVAVLGARGALRLSDILKALDQSSRTEIPYGTVTGAIDILKRKGIVCRAVDKWVLVDAESGSRNFARSISIRQN